MKWFKSFSALFKLKKLPLLKVRNLTLSLGFILSTILTIFVFYSSKDILLSSAPILLFSFLSLVFLRRKGEDSEKEIVKRFYCRLVLELDVSQDVKTALEKTVSSLPISKLKSKMEDYLNSLEDNISPPPLEGEDTLVEKDLFNHFYQGLKKGRINGQYIARLQEHIEECYPLKSEEDNPLLYFLFLLVLEVSFCLIVL